MTATVLPTPPVLALCIIAPAHAVALFTSRGLGTLPFLIC